MPPGNQFPPLGPDGFEVNPYNLTAPTQFPPLGPDGFEIDTIPQPNIQQPQPNQQFDELIDDVQMQDDPMNDAGPQAQQQAQQQQPQQLPITDNRIVPPGATLSWVRDFFKDYVGEDINVQQFRGGVRIHNRSYRVPPENRFSSFWHKESYTFVYPKDDDSPGFLEGDEFVFTLATELQGIQGATAAQVYNNAAVGHCMLNPVVEWCQMKFDEAKKGSSTKRAYRKRLEDLVEEKKRYSDAQGRPTGVPHSEVKDLCERIGFKATIVAPLANRGDETHVFGCSLKKPFKHFKFINCAFNHVEEYLDDGEIVKVTQDQLQEMKIEFTENNTSFLWTENKFGISKINTSSATYVAESPFGDAMNSFERETGIENMKVDLIKEPKLSAYLARGLHMNLATFIIRPPSDEPLVSVDLKKSYATFRTCRYYEQNKLPGAITNLSATDKIEGPGIYGITNLDFSECSDQFKKLMHLTKYPYRNNNRYPVPDLHFLTDQKVRYTIIDGAWAGGLENHLDFEFPGDPDLKTGFYQKNEKNTSFFSMCVGMWSAETDTQKTYMNGPIEFFESIKERCPSKDVRYNNNGTGFIAYRRSSALWLPHVFSYINAYERIRIYDQALDMDLSNVVALRKDEIIFHPHEFTMHSGFAAKTPKLLMHESTPYPISTLWVPDPRIEAEIAAFNATCHEDEMADYGPEPIMTPPSAVTSGRVLAVGAGGCGKTTRFLDDEALVSPLFAPPGWLLARKKEEEHCVRVDVWSNVTSDDIEKFGYILKSVRNLIMDETTMYTFHQVMQISERFKHIRVIWCGDCGYRVVYQLPPVHNRTDIVTIEKFEKYIAGQVMEFTTNYRCKCDKLLSILNELRAFIDGSHKDCSEDDTDRHLMNMAMARVKTYARLHNRLLTTDQIIERASPEDMILCARKTEPHAYTKEYTGAIKRKLDDEEAAWQLPPPKRKWVNSANNREHQNGQIIFAYDKPTNNCEEAYAHTVHVSQGLTVYDDLYVDTRAYFELQMLYVAISRAQYIDQIWIQYQDFITTQANVYSQCKVYRISSAKGKVNYIGHTCQDIQKRFKRHLKDYETDAAKKCASQYVIRHGDAICEIVEVYPCSSRAEAVARETWWIAATSGCVNSNDLPRDPFTDKPTQSRTDIRIRNEASVAHLP